MLSGNNVGDGADAELTTLIFEVAVRRLPLRQLISRIHRNRISNANAVSSIFSIPGIDGTIPLHRACQFGSPAMVTFLLKLGVKYCAGGRNGGTGGLFVQSRAHAYAGMVAPFDLAVERVRLICNREKNMSMTKGCNERDMSNNNSGDEGWEVLSICVQYTDAARYRRPIGTALQNWLQDASGFAAAVGIVPVDLLVPMIKKVTHFNSATTYTDRFGRSILTKVIHVATEAQQNYEEENNFDDWRIVFQTLLNMDKNHKHSSIGKGENKGEELLISTTQDHHRQPLHIAAEYGLDWFNGIKPILQSDYDMLLEQDTATRLYPFMLAATGTYLDKNRRSVLQLLKKILVRRYSVLGGTNPWIDLYSCFHVHGSCTGEDDYGERRRIVMKKKKNEFWKDILHGSKKFVEEGRVTIPKPDIILFRNEEGTFTLCKEEAFSVFYAAAGMQSNLDTTFELLRQNPAIMNRFVVRVISTTDNTITTRDSKKNHRVCDRERKRKKQRDRRRRLRKNKKLTVT